MTAGQRQVLVLLADLAGGRATPTPSGPMRGRGPDEPERMTDAQAGRAYALDAAAAMFS